MQPTWRPCRGISPKRIANTHISRLKRVCKDITIFTYYVDWLAFGYLCGTYKIGQENIVLTAPWMGRFLLILLIRLLLVPSFVRRLCGDHGFVIFERRIYTGKIIGIIYKYWYKWFKIRVVSLFDCARGRFKFFVFDHFFKALLIPGTDQTNGRHS